MVTDAFIYLPHSNKFQCRFCSTVKRDVYACDEHECLEPLEVGKRLRALKEVQTLQRIANAQVSVRE